MKNKKGEQVFKDNIDEILTEKIIEHSKNNAEKISKENINQENPSEEKNKSTQQVFKYHTPEQKKKKRLLIFIVVSLVSFVLAGLGLLFLKKFTKD
jgi:hypothetical protein